MALDQKLLESYAVKPDQSPILHLYAWERPSLTYGYFIEPLKYLNQNGLEEMGCETARRPTGGGITLHLTDFAFSLLIPAHHYAYSVNILDNYAYVNKLIIEVLKKFTPKLYSLLEITAPVVGQQAQHHCLAQPTKYDIVIEGKKVGGAAQRRTKHAYLHQGTIALALPEETFSQKILLSSSEVIPAMQKHTYPLLGFNPSPKEIETARSELKAMMKHILCGS